MQTQAFQPTRSLPADLAQPAVARPKPNRPRVMEQAIRDAAQACLGELPVAEKPTRRSKE